MINSNSIPLLMPFFFSPLQTGKKERSNTLNIAIENMCKKTRDLRRQVSEKKDVETNTT